MTEPPGRGHPRPVSIETALDDLGVGAGPDAAKLVRGDTPSLRLLMGMADTPTTWQPNEVASGIISIIIEQIEQLPKDAWLNAAQVVFRLPAAEYFGTDFDSLNARRSARVKADHPDIGTKDLDKGRNRLRDVWRNTVRPKLAISIEDFVASLNQTEDGWEKYRPPDSDGDRSRSPRLPLTFDRTEALWTFEKRRGVHALSLREIIAHEPIDHYDPVGWYYNDPDAPVEIAALANCVRVGEMKPLPQGGRTTRLEFSHTLQPEERYFFAYITHYNSGKNCRPAIMYEVRGRAMKLLTLRAQFDPDELPTRCWYFDVEAQNEGWEIPSANAPNLLSVSPNGYVTKDFHDCDRGRRYGIRWEWPQATSEASATSLISPERRDAMGEEG